MVTAIVKSGQAEKCDQFLFETKATETVASLITRMVAVWNARVRVKMLINCVRQLAEFGPMKAPDQQGLDSVTDALAEEAGEGAVVDISGEKHAGGVYETKTVERSPYYKADPNGYRTGNAPPPALAQVLLKQCDEAEKAISSDLVGLKVYTTIEKVTEIIQNFKGAVMIAFPAGLPAWDTVRMAIDTDIMGEVQGIQGANEILDGKTATLWFAGKEMVRGGSENSSSKPKLVKDYVGRHEKTKFKCRLQRAGASAPAREPAINEAERKAMMAHYFKKQQEYKKLAENDDDDFHSSAWASGSNLKSSLLGTASIKAPGIR